MKIQTWNKLTKSQKEKLLQRPLVKNNLFFQKKVQHIISRVRKNGDRTLLEYTQKFDDASLKKIRVSNTEFEKAKKNVSKDNINAILFAKKQIESYHRAFLPIKKTIQTINGVFCERIAKAIQSVGLYIPGGSAPLVSTLLMLAVPANLVNCPLKILCTPPNSNGEINPYLLAAAKLCGIEQVYKVGGAQAIAAMAYGTQTIPKVDKLFGPGNAWVTAAKMQVSQDPQGASIDLPAGPSELLIIADQFANSDWVAADLLSQAEHGEDSQVILLTNTMSFAEKVKASLLKQLKLLKRQAILKVSLRHSKMIVVDDLELAIKISNQYAPEHLILQVSTPKKYLPLIQHAGAIFIGPGTAETLGDYVTGSNHVLPTNGFAKSYSGLSVVDFMKFISVQQVTEKGLKKIGPYAEKLAVMEGLDAHREAVSIRLR